jgi:hypothetical protein
MLSIYEDTEREDKNHISEVFVAFLEHCEKIKNVNQSSSLSSEGGPPVQAA